MAHFIVALCNGENGLASLFQLYWELSSTIIGMIAIRPAEKYNFVFWGFWRWKSTKSTEKYKKFLYAILALF
jgi:hypothetical protein